LSEPFPLKQIKVHVNMYFSYHSHLGEELIMKNPTAIGRRQFCLLLSYL